jgi:hypothetical protein
MTASLYKDPCPKHLVWEGRFWNFLAGLALRGYPWVPKQVAIFFMKRTLRPWGKLAAIQRQLEGR